MGLGHMMMRAGAGGLEGTRDARTSPEVESHGLSGPPAQCPVMLAQINTHLKKEGWNSVRRGYLNV